MWVASKWPSSEFFFLKNQQYFISSSYHIKDKPLIDREREKNRQDMNPRLFYHEACSLALCHNGSPSSNQSYKRFTDLY